MSKKLKTILVTGDVIADHHLYVGERAVPNDTRKIGTLERKAEGGAGLLYRILEAVGKNKPADQSFHLFDVQFGLRKAVYHKLPCAFNGYALWKPFLSDSGQKVWRMAQPLGYGDPCPSPFPYAKYTVEPTIAASVVVIDDGGLGFRHNTQKSAWPKAIQKKQTSKPYWVVLKMSSPVGQGDLWRHLSSQFRERLVVVVSIGDIRREEVRVSRGISWERTALDLAEELCCNAEIRCLLNSQHLIVHFGSEGALYVNNSTKRKSFHLVYDPEHLEREWSDEDHGRGLGYMACLTTGIVHRLVQQHQANTLLEGITAGLSAMRIMHRAGHGVVGCKKPGFPLAEVVEDVINPKFRYCSIQLPNPQCSEWNERKTWTIMTEVLEGIQKNPRPLYGIGRRVAVQGPEALTQIPFARFGILSTADRNEIESLRNIRMMILDYERQDRGKKPLSIAVFGPPGAGKSFGIIQIAKGVLGDKVPILNFNLSQFTSPGNLTGAFHQVRDKVLEGTTPIVFWDEFDSREYEWLQYLLAPMQDGKFLEGQITHPIGKCIFVFAGGTSYDMENFGPQETDEIKWKEFKMKKGPDFKSRLSGYLNVLGPNQRQKYDPHKKKWINDPGDICFPVRRALIIRTTLRLKENERLDIDHGILSALIEVREFKHGARSLEKILRQLKKPDVPAIRRSNLPSEEILSLHVDYSDFINIVNRDMKFKTHAEDLAPFVHEFYRNLGVREKWIRPEMNVDYDELSEDYKEDNRAAATRISQVLDLVGLYVVPKASRKLQAVDEIMEIIETNIDMLAEAEHNEWMEYKIRNGWSFGKPRDDSQKKHDCLIPYHLLDEKNKDKDRNTVRHYPDILKKANYKIVSSLEQ